MQRKADSDEDMENLPAIEESYDFFTPGSKVPETP
jgi:hypothetical protein